MDDISQSLKARTKSITNNSVDDSIISFYLKKNSRMAEKVISKSHTSLIENSLAVSSDILAADRIRYELKKIETGLNSYEDLLLADLRDNLSHNNPDFELIEKRNKKIESILDRLEYL